MPVVLLLAALAVVAATVVLASGRGGELAEPVGDNPPSSLPDGRAAASADVRSLWLPKSPWGYNVPVTNDALGKLTQALAVREQQVERLEREIVFLRDEARRSVEAEPKPAEGAEFAADAGSTASEPWEDPQGGSGPVGWWERQEEPWKSGEKPGWHWEEQEGR
ncbi:hypothetical protein GCM10022221_05900 [Actinocorallia aurea]